MFDWNGYFSLAEELVKKCNEFSNTDACYRTSVSRFYYAAYHCCYSYASSVGYLAQNPDTHQKLIDFLKMYKDTDVKQMGHDLERCRKLRVNADYYSNRNIHNKHFIKAKTSAENIRRVTAGP